MRIRPEDAVWRETQSLRDGAVSREAVEKDLLELAPRAGFVREYLRRGGRDTAGRKLDPVLAFHLGLSETGRDGKKTG